MRDVVHSVRISSSDFVARRDAVGGAGPVVDAPRPGAGAVLVCPLVVAGWLEEFALAVIPPNMLVGAAAEVVGLAASEEVVDCPPSLNSGADAVAVLDGVGVASLFLLKLKRGACEGAADDAGAASLF